MRNSILAALFGVAALSAIPASASTANFDFTSCTVSGVQTENSTCDSAGYSNSTGSFTQTIGTGANAITVTATAFVATSGSSGTALSGGASAAVGQYNVGLGVCSTGDTGYSTSNPSAGCTSPNHQIDNSTKFDFIEFAFSTPVNLSTITLANFGPGTTSSTIDMDMSYWVSSTAFTTVPGGAINVFCGDTSEGAADQHSSCPASQGTAMTDTLSNGSSTISYLLVAAYTGSTSSPADSTADYFKIQGLNVSTGSQVVTTPEPATFGLIGLSLAGLGLLRRKRK